MLARWAVHNLGLISLLYKYQIFTVSAPSSSCLLSVYLASSVYYPPCVCFTPDGHPGIPGGCIWERTDELHRRAGTDHAAAHHVTRAATYRHVLSDVTPRQTPASGRQPRERQSDDTATVGAAETGRLQQKETDINGRYWCSQTCL